jgi:hypothetical protein
MLSDHARRWWRAAILVVLVAGAAARASVVFWTDPWGPHQPDEHILPLEALALWEGVTPREVGWPATTNRLLLSGVNAGRLLAAKGDELWKKKSNPAETLGVITKWIGEQYVDPTPLYKTGRLLSVIAGIIQLVLLVWALSQWVGPIGVAVGTFAVAMSPLPVRYSQYVLADIMALLFATVMVGLAAKPTERRVIVMAALVGLAASSKFHFGLWLFTPMLIGVRLASTPARRVLMVLASIGMCAWVLVTLVPWLWINPLLAVKEFLAVVAVKLFSGEGGHRWELIPHNIALIFDGIGITVLVGVVAAVYFLRRAEWHHALPLVVSGLIAFGILVMSGTVFDRYSLLLLPGAVVVAALGWDQWVTAPSVALRRVATGVLAVCAAVTLVSLWRAERVTGEIDVDELAKRWVIDHAPPNSRVGVHDEMNALLPRSADQLEACSHSLEAEDAYQRKWKSEGLSAKGVPGDPMRSMVLNDEEFEVYWCRRELLARTSPGFVLVRYHDGPRFDAVQESDVLHEFADGETAVTGGVDVLVINRAVDVGRPPAVVLSTARGNRFIYQR